MKSTAIGLILCSVLLSSFAQLAMKKGMSASAVQSSLALGSSTDIAVAIASNLHVILGLLMYALGAAIWLLVLAKVDVTFAYPFIGLGFVITALLGWLLLGESISLVRAIGTTSIVIGIILIASS